jgi:hypothetical protein
MALFPKIDSQCPLDIEEQRRLDGYCHRCHKHVHALDGMGEGERRALLANAPGPLCVSYRRGTSRAASLAAVAITLMAGAAHAGEECADKTAPSLLGATHQSAEVTRVEAHAIAVSKEDETTEQLEQLEFIVVGGITSPQDAEWVDDSSLPELPMRAEEPSVLAAVHAKAPTRR